jgi:hypothetical protein
VTADDVDLAASQAAGDGKAAALSPDVAARLLDVFGEPSRWAARPEPVKTTNAVTFHYRVALRGPAAIGSMRVEADSRSQGEMTFRALKADAAFPGDPEREADWLPLDASRRADSYECVFPAGVSTRAVLCLHRAPPDALSALRRWNLLRARLQNLAPLAIAQAEQAPRGTKAAALAQGREWANAGEDDEGRIARQPVSSVAPCWFHLVWDAPQTLSAFRLSGQVAQFKLYAFAGDAARPPGTCGC